MQTVFRFLSFLAAGALAACSSAQPGSAPGTQSASAAPPMPPGIYCVWKPTLRFGYYTVIDDQHFTIEDNSKAYYLVTLFQKCFDLDTQINLAFVARSNEICSAGDSVIAGRQRCPISGIEPVGSPQEARALVAARKAPPAAAPTQ